MWQVQVVLSLCINQCEIYSQFFDYFTLPIASRQDKFLKLEEKWEYSLIILDLLWPVCCEESFLGWWTLSV